jgi:hypothetical protein
MIQLYSQNYIQTKVKEQGFGFTAATFSDYIRKGIIPQPDYFLLYKGKYQQSLYTKKTADKAVEMIVAKRNTVKTCSKEGCFEKHCARGLCFKHYQLQKYYIKKKQQSEGLQDPVKSSAKIEI